MTDSNYAYLSIICDRLKGIEQSLDRIADEIEKGR